MTAREHFLAHWLLYRIHKGSIFSRQASGAFFAMCSFKNHKTQEEERIKCYSSRMYAEAREANAISYSELMTGRKKRKRSVSMSEKQRHMISERMKNKMKGRKMTDKEKENLSMLWKLKNPMHNSSLETLIREKYSIEEAELKIKEIREKMSLSHRGKSKSEETKKKMRKPKSKETIQHMREAQQKRRKECSLEKYNSMVNSTIIISDQI